MLGERTGFYVFKDVFPAKVLNNLERVLRLFHHKWCEANQAFYQQKAINSAYLTDSKWLANTQRAQLFQFISSPHLLKIVEHYIAKPAFLNTQLFFSPYNNAQKNYWHRDIQYGYSDEQQKALLHEVDLMPHFRIPLADEQGLELIPGSHRRWDTPEEYDVRMTRNSRQSHFDLPGGEAISLQRGDVLMFSAKLLHRGLYQPDRFAFDVLFAPSDSHYLQSVETCCLPGENMPDSIATANVFLRTKCALQVPKE